MVSSEGDSLINVGTIPNLNISDGYKYLGIFQDFLFDDDKLSKLFSQNIDLGFMVCYLRISMVTTKLLP